MPGRVCKENSGSKSLSCAGRESAVGIVAAFGIVAVFGFLVVGLSVFGSRSETAIRFRFDLLFCRLESVRVGTIGV